MNWQTLSASVAQMEKRVAIQGEKGSYHELAAQEYFGQEVKLEMCDSFLELFRTMEKGTATFGVMAIENSVAGSILPNYAMLRESNFTIIGEKYLRIAHCLMALPGQKIEDIKEIYSHPMALRQCHHFFAKYPHIKLVEMSDTAGSAKWIRENQHKGKAAIASALAAQHYDLEIIAEGIETNKRNFTRFLVLLDKKSAVGYQREPNKSSLCFNLADRSRDVGSLSSVLLVLSAHGVNLTKIQSLPLLGKEWEYFFHVDLEYEDHAQYQRSLDAITPLVTDLKILGEYPRGDKNIAIEHT